MGTVRTECLKTGSRHVLLRAALMVSTALVSVPALADIVTSGNATPTLSSTTDVTENNVSIGNGATGSLTVNNGNTLTLRDDEESNNDLFVGIGNNGDGTVSISGSNSTIITTGNDSGVGIALSSTSAVGSMTIDNGGLLDTMFLEIGRYGAGRLTVTGSNSRVTATTQNGLDTDANGNTTSLAGFVTVGRNDGSQGTLRIEDGAQMTVGPGTTSNTETMEAGINIGRNSGSTGTVIVTGSGSSLTVSQNVSSTSLRPFITVGRGGTGSMTISDGASVTVDGGLGGSLFRLGRDSGSEGTATITGNGTTVTLTGTGNDHLDVEFRVGQNGSGSLTVQDGATLTVHDRGTNETDIVFASESGSTGTGRFTGSGTTVQMTGSNSAMLVGSKGTGSLTVSDGASFTGLDIEIGENAGSTGAMTVEGGASVMLSGQDSAEDGSAGPQFRVGESGTGTLTITSGGTVTITNSSGGDKSGMTIGQESGSTGSVTVTGSGSSLNAGDAIHIAMDFDETNGGTGTLTVTDGGTAQASSIFIGSAGTLKGNGALVGSVFNRGGMVAPGTSIGALSIQGNYTQTAGTLQTEIASATSHDRLNVTGSATIAGGTLSFSFLDNFVPEPGFSIDYIDATDGVTIDSNVQTSFSGLPSDFASGEFERLVVDGGKLSYVTSASVQEEAVESVSQVQTRATTNAITSSVVGRIRAIGAGLARLSVPTTDTTGVPGGNGELGLGVWLDGSYTRIEQDRTGEVFDGNSYVGLIGVDYRLTERALVGAALGVESSDITLVSSSGELDTKGFSGTVYGAYQVADTITVSILGGYAGIDNDIEESQLGSRVTGDYDSQRLLTGGNIGFFKAYDRLEFLTDFGVTYTHEWFDTYTASSGLQVLPPNSRLAQLSGGLEVAYAFDVAVPFVTATVSHDVFTSRDVDSNGDEIDETGVNLGGGIRVPINDWVEGGILGNAELGRAKEETYTVSASLRMRF